MCSSDLSEDVGAEAVFQAVNDTLGAGVVVLAENGDLLSAMNEWSVEVAPEATTEAKS